jgi:hypothetical protein
MAARSAAPAAATSEVSVKSSVIEAALARARERKAR